MKYGSKEVEDYNKEVLQRKLRKGAKAGSFTRKHRKDAEAKKDTGKGGRAGKGTL